VLGFLALAGMFFGFYIVPNMGKRLIYSQQLCKSDLIFILMGSIPDRALQASQIYREGYAKQILFANEQQFGAEKLKPYGIELETTASIITRTLIKLNVAKEHIETLPNIARSTQDEAILLRDYLAQHPQIKRVILVTSSYHSRRAAIIFTKAINKAHLPVTIIMSQNLYSDFKSERWWDDRASAYMVLLEHIKLINFYLREQFAL
jgi:uncharacterized SAM-binding protein YcdF (DUF218 family)